MADPVNTIVDEIPIPNGTSFIEYFNDTLYCTGGPTRRINLRTKEIRELGPDGVGSLAIAGVDFHRPFGAPADDGIVIVGSGSPDGRIYVTTDGDFQAAEIIPPVLDQFTQFKLSPHWEYTPFVTAMVAANTGKSSITSTREASCWASSTSAAFRRQSGRISSTIGRWAWSSARTTGSSTSPTRSIFHLGG